MKMIFCKYLFHIFISNYKNKATIFYLRFCIYMMEKYDNDHEKMTKDYKNHYQETSAQISKKIKLFKNMKLPYEKYLAEKKSGKNFLK